jgi:hypothetical protein
VLADDIVADRCLGVTFGPDFVACQRRIAAATRFVLAADFALAADGLVENVPELEKIAPFCRLPYPATWLELAHLDRHHWRGAPLHYPGLQRRPIRVGFLLEATAANLASWRATMFWSLHDPPSNSAPNNASLIVIDYRTDQPFAELSDLVAVDVADFSDGVFTGDRDVDDGLIALSRSDWAGEIKFIFAALGLLNARNVVERQRVDLTRLNRARVRSGKPPFLAREVLKIRALHRPSLAPSGSRAEAADVRSHFVRGHFKTRRSGVFWWGPHVRGRVGGAVDRDYEVHR